MHLPRKPLALLTTLAAAGGLTGIVVGTELGADAAGSSSYRVRVATWNIHQGFSGMANVARDIRDTGATVVGLNEVRPGQTTYLVRHTSLKFARYYPVSDKRGGKIGNTILSKYPIVDYRQVNLPHATKNCKPRFKCQKRTLIQALIRVNKQEFWFNVTHLNPGAFRDAQANVVRNRIGQPRCNSILVGDMNATPGSATHRILTTNLGDAWRRLGKGSGATAPAAAPKVRIDYIFFAPGNPPRSVWVMKRGASDHRGVVSGFDLPNRRV